MRIVQPTHLSPLPSTSPTLVFRAERGERFLVDVLEEDLVRVRHYPEGAPRLDRTWMVVGPDGDVPVEGRSRDDMAHFSRPDFGLETAGSSVDVRTQKLHLAISLDDFRIRWHDDRERCFAADLAGRAYSYDRSSRAVYHYMEHRLEDHYYGFGERCGPLDKAGMRFRMVNLDALSYDAKTTDPLYKHFPFYITLVPELGLAYGLLYDNLSSAEFDMGREIDAYHGRYRTYVGQDGDIDYYLIFGPTVREVVEKLARLTGTMALPPRWSLGYLGSTMTYTDMPDAQVQLRRFVDLCAEHDIPCDMFHLSSGYGSGQDGKRYVFTWNREKIPDPRGMVDHFHAAGIRLAANIKPCLLTTHPRYEEAAAKGLFIMAAGSDRPELSVFWGGYGSYLDFTNPAAYAWWQENVRTQLLDYGIDATWNDNNEYEIWDDEAQCAGGGRPIRISMLRPLFSTLQSRASREAQLAARPAERPYLICRSGCPGIQRYAQSWSGDNSTSWQTLRYNIPMGLSMGLSGAPNIGHDVGGFAGNQPEPELFVRWVQNGIFHPRFSIHSWHSDGTVNEPWMYPEVLPLIRSAVEFRYRLIPYLYTLMFEAAETGHPIVRPMVYAYQDDPRCQVESFDFMLGPNLLVASVLEPGARTRGVYLPSGTQWCDFHTGEWYDGGQVVELPAPLDRIPLLAPAGGLVPMGKAMRHVGEQPDDLREVYVFPHPVEGDGEFELVEDDGLSLDYRQGAVARVRLAVSARPDGIRLTVDRPRGAFALSYSEIHFLLPPGEGRPVYLGEATTPTRPTPAADGRPRVTWRVPGP